MSGFLIGPCGVAPAPTAGASFAFKGGAGGNAGGDALTVSTIDIGTAAANRRIIVAAADQNGVGISGSGITVNGVTLTQDISFIPSSGLYIYSGVVSTGSGAATIVVNFNTGGAFTDRNILVWSSTGAATSVVQQTVTGNPAGSTSMSIAVNAGDFMIVIDPFSATFSGSTQAPSTTRSSTTGSHTLSAGEWNTISATNASFSIVPGFSDLMAAATYN